MASVAYDLFGKRAESHLNQMKKNFQRYVNLMTEAKFFFFLFDLYFVQLILIIGNVKKKLVALKH